jgi:hypothetical protein
VGVYEHDLKVEFHPPIDMNASKICTYIIPPLLQSFIILALNHIKKIKIKIYTLKRLNVWCIYNVMKFYLRNLDTANGLQYMSMSVGEYNV